MPLFCGVDPATTANLRWAGTISLFVWFPRPMRKGIVAALIPSASDHFKNPNVRRIGHRAQLNAPYSSVARRRTALRHAFHEVANPFW